MKLKRIVPQPPNRQVRDLPGDDELLPAEGKVVDSSHPHWAMLQRIGWVTILDLPKPAEKKAGPASSPKPVPLKKAAPLRAPAQKKKGGQKKGGQKKGGQKKGGQKKGSSKSLAETRAEAARLKAEAEAAKE
jgi:hypothetical protein